MVIQANSKLRVRGVIKVQTYGNSRVKRGYDLLLGAVLLVFSAPCLLVALMLNTVVTRGHPLFVQRRVGRNGVEFGLLKLRTMRMPKNGEVWLHRTIVDDRRLTLLGGLFRRAYVDELPQLINVLVGDMSMVGPRPETPETTSEISVSNPRFKERTLVKPGISGVAQVFFRKPESDHDLWRRYYYDRAYIAKCSLILDLKLTALTLIHVLRYRGT
ncbi:sugar transferase [SAR202 cluster bacterium AD-812-D07_MRT_10900m]|nr:sugar transferase [SAR202 cluster bacterium AD-812-D07_MRT_10900m]